LLYWIKILKIKIKNKLKDLRKFSMSRIGKKSIEIPESVSIKIENESISIQGKYGILTKSFLNYVTISLLNNELIVSRKDDTKLCKAYHGLSRSLLQNMVIGVDEKFSKTLIAEGVGYKFQLDQNKIVLNMGYTNPVKMEIPTDLTIKLESPTKISIQGIDKEKVGFLAAKIRMVRPPEPYKGKGIRYEGEKIIRKAGKTGK
jgi:large subunit ribosomal protein L6